MAIFKGEKQIAGISQLVNIDESLVHQHINKTVIDGISSQNISDWNNKASVTYVDTQLGNKVDKISGKGLSTNDYTSDDKLKVEGIISTGDGTKFKSDDGTYKIVPIAGIDDTTPSTTTTYSSSKIETKLDDKSDILHTHDSLHTHINKTVLEGITAENVTIWEDKTSKIITNGAGDMYLSNDGTYKTVSGGTANVTVCTETEITTLINSIF